MLLVPTVQCWSYRSLFSRSGFSKESLEQIKQNLVLHRNEIWRVRFCECIYYKYFLNACILTYVSFEGRQNQIRKHIQHNRSYNFHRLKSVSRNPSVKRVPPPPPHPRLALTDENVLKSYEAATAQICWFFFLTYIPHLPELKLMPTTSVNFFLLIFVDKTVEVERAIYEG